MVEQSLRARGFAWQFRTEAVLVRPHSIRIQTHAHPFRFLHQRWGFESVGEQGARVSLKADYQLRGLPLRAFEQRAHEKLG